MGEGQPATGAVRGRERVTGARADGPRVALYATAWCGYCAAARALLHQKGIEFSEIDVDEDPKLRQEMLERSGRRTVPQVFVGEQHIGGYDDLMSLDRSGELDALLAGAR